MPDLPPTFNAWPQQHDALPVDEVVKLYDRGFAGVIPPTAKERAEFQAENPFPQDQYGVWEDSGSGKLVIPFVYVNKMFPDCLPGGAQGRGDCVSWSTRNGILTTWACELVAGLPDEVSGLVEGCPDISPEAIKAGVLSTEAIYWLRAHGGDGWSCEAAANVVKSKSGLWLRKKYDDLGVDLTVYNSKTAGIYGASPPPEKFLEVGRQHLVRALTTLRGPEQIRDFLFNGYGVSSCGSEGFSNSRDENGVSKRSGSWAHALAYVGFDDRETTKSKYGGPLVLVQNSWGQWNSGPRKIMGTDIEIPIGSFWARWSDVQSRSAIAFSSVNGWPPRNLPAFKLSLG